MIIKRWGFLGLGVDHATPSPEMNSRERRAYHALWMVEFKWHHAMRHWLFGGLKPLPLNSPNSISRRQEKPALWERVANTMLWRWHHTTKSEDWRSFDNWFNSLPEAPEPGESSVVFVDSEGKWDFAGKVTKEGVLKWTK